MSTDFVNVVFAEPNSGPEQRSVRYTDFVNMLLKPDTPIMTILHCAIGVAGEAGELADAIKKEHIYGKPRNLKHIVEELGDLEFYMEATREFYSISRKDVLAANAAKLQKRYVDLVYDGAAAIARADKEDGDEDK